MYATRESVAAALDVRAIGAPRARELDRIIASASRSAEVTCHRPYGGFAPVLATRYFDWPNYSYAYPWRLWLEEDEVVSVTTLTSGGTVIPGSAYRLEPVNAGPPFASIEIDLAGASAFSAGSTHQRSIAVTGVFGCRDDSTPAGTVAEVLDASETDVDVSSSAWVGVGSILKVDSERLLVTGRSLLTSGQTLQTPVGASAAEVGLAVTDGSAFTAGEVLTLDTERMMVDDIAGNALVVRRAYDGSVLASHAGSTIYAPRRLTVERGALGTTAASHLTAAPLTLFVPPSLVEQYVEAKSIDALLQRRAGYGRTVGSGDNEREASGRALARLTDDLIAAHGRTMRTAAI